jgi:catechol 2,3-dioxygenase-like lactoylglutathione lyase family enzyme
MAEMRLEMIPVSVSDVDRAEEFYVDKLGFEVDYDFRPADHGLDVASSVRALQLTPPGSACSILVVSHFPASELPPGSAFGIHLCVSDIHETRAELLGRGVEVGEVVEAAGALHAAFRDPDGNEFWLQQKPDSASSGSVHFLE